VLNGSHEAIDIQPTTHEKIFACGEGNNNKKIHQKNADNGRQCRQWQITKVLFMVSVLNHATVFFS
jgi:hypothetical protein